MYPAPLSDSKLWPFALELTLLVMVGSAVGAALASAILLALAGLISEGIPLRKFSLTSYVPPQFNFDV